MVRGLFGPLSGIRRARWAAVCALAFTCVWVPAGRARQQQPTSDTPAKKTTPTAKKTVPKPKTTSHTSAASTSAKKSTGTTHTASGTHSSRKRKSVRARGQQKIDSERARSIQEALIREHYLSGEATGTWNQSSEDAMRKYQADHGWQSKTVPDSRALIKLGLGPSKDHLLNPESAMTTGPDGPRSESMPTTSHPASPTTDPTPTQPNQSDSSHPQ